MVVLVVLKDAPVKSGDLLKYEKKLQDKSKAPPAGPKAPPPKAPAADPATPFRPRADHTSPATPAIASTPPLLAGFDVS